MLTLIFPHFALQQCVMGQGRPLAVTACGFFWADLLTPQNIFIKCGWGPGHYVHSVGKPFLLATWGFENPPMPPL